MNDSSPARLQFARKRAAGRLEGVAWVDADLEPERTDWTVSERGFHSRSVVGLLPTAIQESARAAHARGLPTLVQGVQLLLADTDWMVESRSMLWSPDSPEPRLLVSLLEHYGVEAMLHRNDPMRLQRLAARLKPWLERRGGGGAREFCGRWYPHLASFNPLSTNSPVRRSVGRTIWSTKSLLVGTPDGGQHGALHRSIRIFASRMVLFASSLVRAYRCASGPKIYWLTGPQESRSIGDCFASCPSGAAIASP